MKNSKFNKELINEYAMPTIVLVIICLVITFALVATFKVTEPIIKATMEKEAELARTQVLPESDGFKLVESSGNNVLEVYKATNDTGFVITTVDKGYGGRIKVITGFSSEGFVEKVLLLEQKETPGLGTKVGEKKFTDQFIGLDGVETVDTISGSTISSKAMIRAVDSAISQMKTIKEGGIVNE